MEAISIRQQSLEPFDINTWEYAPTQNPKHISFNHNRICGDIFGHSQSIKFA